MKKVGRNAPCPCGSGKKYKMCCLKREEEKPAVSPMAPPGYFEDHLDKDSNRVVDLLHQGRIEEAGKAAEALLEKYPDMPDGFERTGAVLEARGEWARAAEFYRQAAAKFIENDPDNVENAEFCRSKARELEEKDRAGG